MKIQNIKISKIKTNPNNPRVIKNDKFNKLVKSIKEFPKMLNIRPIVVNSDMIVLGGNMRLKACKSAGLKEIPVMKVEDLTEEQQNEFIIKDNASFGSWNWDMLANTWNSDTLNTYGIDVPQWEESEDKFDSDIEETGEYDFPEEENESSHVRMVQLYLNSDTEPIFRKCELKLREKFATDNMTDTVFKLITKACED